MLRSRLKVDASSTNMLRSESAPVMGQVPSHSLPSQHDMGYPSRGFVLRKHAVARVAGDEL